MRKNQIAFRPSVDGALLEERVVLSSGSLKQAAALVSSTQTGLTAVQLRRTFAQEFRTAQNDLRLLIGNQITLAFRNGTPTAQQLADLNNRIQGAINATTFRLSSQAALLPNANARLVPAIQNALLGSNTNGLLNRIQALTQSQRATSSIQSLQNAVARQLNTAFVPVTNQLAGFFKTTPLNRLSVDQTTGQRIPLQQFLGNQVVNQLGNTLGSLSQGFPTVANSTLFANGLTTATPSAIAAFQNQANQALATAAFQLGNNLALFPNGSMVSPALQSALFAQGHGANSLFNSLQGLPNTSANFNTAASTAFTNGFSGLVSPLSSFFGLPTTQTFNLPTANIPSIFGTSFTNFGNGFNNGFGSGSVGFGTPTSNFNTTFGTGFSDMLFTMNPTFGFTVPTTTFGTGTGSGIGTGFM